jgi:hypothetical protein
MNLLTKLLATLTCGVGLTLSTGVAQAYDIGPASPQLCATSNITAEPNTKVVVESAACANGTVEELYKANVGSTSNPATTESGPFAASYDTEFFNSPLDPMDATISFVAPPSIDCDLYGGCFLAVKDGNQEPALYVFNISDWNGTDDLVLTGFWPNQGAISHVSIWGGGDGGGDDDEIPEPASLALVAFALIAAGAARRRRRA